MSNVLSLLITNRTMDAPGTVEAASLPWHRAIGLACGAVAAFHLAYAFSALSCLMLVFLCCLIELAGLPTPRKAFYFGLVIGEAVYAPHLLFFWKLFGWSSIALWTVLAFWLGLFVALARLCRLRFGRLAVVQLPFVWTGLEYFRGELYHLRFSWLNAGYAFSDSPHVLAAAPLGMYGLGWTLMALAGTLFLVSPKKAALLLVLYLAGLGTLVNRPPGPGPGAKSATVQVAGIQMEFPAEPEVAPALDSLIEEHPEAELIVLSEYTFLGPIPDQIKDWCGRNRKYLVAGGKDFLSPTDFYNTAFVVDPNGDVVFKQAKSVPVQFLVDGRKAVEQRVWDSPWGRIGIAVCYDLSYRRVMDGLIRQGAQAILVPTMDMEEWGAYQHRLHARVAPVRAAEYQVPIFRVCSSGISQLIDGTGRTVASAPYPGQMAMIAGALDLAERGRRPLDAWLAPLSVAVTVGMILWLMASRVLGRISRL